jgi:hypothetical protein
MNAADVVAIAHDGELVCEDCLQGHAEKSVFYEGPDARECADADGYLSPVFAEHLEEGDTCGRCLQRIIS